MTAIRIAGLACALWIADAFADDADFAGARSVAATCASCHGTNGASVTALPSLAGVPRDEIAVKLREFKAGTRTGTLMPQLAKGYTDDQIELVARWFASQPVPRR
jgi:sulfide dehydrogenase cytochrome subunit